MRLTIILFLAVFTFQISDIAPVRRPAAVKTCCGRAICSCKHAKGAACGYRALLEKARDIAAGQHCHLKAKPAMETLHCRMKAKSAPVQEEEVIAPDEQAQAAASFSKAPCHRSSGKSFSVNVCRDMENPVIQEIPLFQKSDFLFPYDFLLPPSMLSRGIERPPQSAFLF